MTNSKQQEIMIPNPIALSARVEILKAQSAVYRTATSDLESRLEKLREAYFAVVSDLEFRKEISDAVAMAIVDFNVGLLNVIITQSGLSDVVSNEEASKGRTA